MKRDASITYFRDIYQRLNDRGDKMGEMLTQMIRKRNKRHLTGDAKDEVRNMIKYLRDEKKITHTVLADRLQCAVRTTYGWYFNSEGPSIKYVDKLKAVWQEEQL